VLLVSSLAWQGALAQEFGLNELSVGLNGALPTANTDLRILAGRLIQIILSFLGVIAVGLILYAGFKWMTSGGDEEKIKGAKMTLKNALIGLLIIMSSWAIASFIMSRLLGALGGTTPSNLPSNPGNLSSAGLSAIGACSVESIYPAPGASDIPRNTNIIISFKEEVNKNSLCYNDSNNSCSCNSTDCRKINPTIIKIYKTDLGDNTQTNITDVVVDLADGDKTLALFPLTFLGSATENTDYSIKITDGLKKKVNNQSMFTGCGTDEVEWTFEVSDKLDLTPPYILEGRIFPVPDNNQDSTTQVIPAVAAKGSITVNDCPLTQAPANVLNIIREGSSVAAMINLNYHGSLAAFKVTIASDNQALLFDGAGNALGTTTFNSSKEADFSGFFSIKVDEIIIGNSWLISIKPEQKADNLVLNNDVYTFATSSVNNNIAVPAVCNKITVAANIAMKLNGAIVRAQPASGPENNKINITATVAGVNGNDIALSSDSSALSVVPLTGGQDRSESTQVNDKPDKPMNSIIQINFSEAINPISVSGLASEVKSSIEIVSASASASATNGFHCLSNQECLSYKCENSNCVGDHLAGKFILSNAYRTLEFISDNECGVNGCGEKIYCLPPSSHLVVKLKAAELNSCSGDDCLSFTPFNNCLDNSGLGYKTCQDADNKNYPLSTSASLMGIRDAASNSLDGNLDSDTRGPISYYDINAPISSDGDNAKWSFFISDKLANSTPVINYIKPDQSVSGVNLVEPIEIKFNTLMMSSSLRTGSTAINNGSTITEHKLLNLRSVGSQALGYWISADNQETEPLDGQPDITLIKISHSPFREYATFIAQAGSGLKDIYQNCYKPSAGPGACVAGYAVTPEAPSCCFGTATAILGNDGNCPTN